MKGHCPIGKHSFPVTAYGNANFLSVNNVTFS